MVELLQSDVQVVKIQLTKDECSPKLCTGSEGGRVVMKRHKKSSKSKVLK